MMLSNMLKKMVSLLKMLMHTKEEMDLVNHSLLPLKTLLTMMFLKTLLPNLSLLYNSIPFQLLLMPQVFGSNSTDLEFIPDVELILITES